MSLSVFFGDLRHVLGTRIADYVLQLRSHIEEEKIMPVKKTLTKKNARQKKLLHTVSIPKHDEVNFHSDDHLLEHREDALKRQMKIIQKDYMKLMLNVTKGYGLLKGWLETQAMMKKDMIKSRIIKI